METGKGFLDIDEVSRYLGMKRSNLYLKVERREIPFYRFGRLLRFRKADIDDWAESVKCEAVDVQQRPGAAIQGRAWDKMDIHRVVRKTIAQLKDLNYNGKTRETRPIRSLGKEVSDGAL